MAGRSTLAMKADELGLELDGEVIGRVLDELKRLEHEGYHFEVADGSLELLLRRATGWVPDYFTVESFRVITDHGERGDADRGGVPTSAANAAFGVTTEATVKVHVGAERIVATAEGNGPVNALDGALRGAIGAKFPALDHIHLTDYRVRVLDTGRGTGAVTRVLVDTTDGAAHLDHDRGVGEHHRGELAGPLRLDRLRAAPRDLTGTGQPRVVEGEHRGVDMTVWSRIAASVVRLPPPRTTDVSVERDLAAKMPDGVVLLADRWYPTQRCGWAADRVDPHAVRAAHHRSARTALRRARLPGGDPELPGHVRLRGGVGAGPPRAGRRPGDPRVGGGAAVVRRPPRHVGRELPRHDAVGGGAGRAGLRQGARRSRSPRRTSATRSCTRAAPSRSRWH